MIYQQSQLKFSENGLEPVISATTVALHYGKHHLAYVNVANAGLTKFSEYRTNKAGDYKALQKDYSFNLNGHLLHELYWSVMRAPQSNNNDNIPTELLTKYFGSVESFIYEFEETGRTVEGSGWVALGVNSEGELLIYQIEKHNLNAITGFQPILVNDMWEHAYYVDYKNDRMAYIKAWWQVVDWDRVQVLYNKFSVE